MTNLSSIINTSGGWANAGAPPSIALEAPVPKPSDWAYLDLFDDWRKEARRAPCPFPQKLSPYSLYGRSGHQ